MISVLQNGRRVNEFKKTGARSARARPKPTSYEETAICPQQSCQETGKNIGAENRENSSRPFQSQRPTKHPPMLGWRRGLMAEAGRSSSFSPRAFASSLSLPSSSYQQSLITASESRSRNFHDKKSEKIYKKILL
jgi:hypothetical protein